MDIEINGKETLIIKMDVSDMSRKQASKYIEEWKENIKKGYTEGIIAIPSTITIDVLPKLN